MSSTPGLCDGVNEVITGFAYNWTQDEIDLFKRCVVGYSEREGFVDTIKGLLYRIWELVKTIIFQSDWQRTVRLIEKDFKVDAINQQIVEKVGSKFTPNRFAKHVISQLISLNELGFRSGSVAFTDFVVPHMIIPSIIKRCSTDPSGKELSEKETVAQMGYVITAAHRLTYYADGIDSTNSKTAENALRAFVKAIFDKITPLLVEKLSSESEFFVPLVAAMVAVTKPILEKLSSQVSQGTLTMDSIKAEFLLMKDTVSTVAGLAIPDFEVEGSGALPAAQAKTRNVTSKRE